MKRRLKGVRRDVPAYVWEYYCISVWITRARWTSDQKENECFLIFEADFVEDHTFHIGYSIILSSMAHSIWIKGKNGGKVQLTIEK